MELIGRRRSVRGAAPSSDNALEVRYPHPLSLYRRPPLTQIALREFEQLAVDRVRALKALLAASAMQGLKVHSTEWRSAAVEQLKRVGLKEMARPPTTPLARHRDHIGHFALRLAYCRSEDLRKWFLSRELELFRLRFSFLSHAEIEKFLGFESLNYEPITNHDKSPIIPQLMESTAGYSTHTRIETADFYKIRFEEAIDLIRNRRVYLDKGYAYIPSNEFISVLSARFRSEMNRALNVALKRLPELEVDQRLATLLKGVHNSYSGNEYTSSKSVIPIESLDSMSQKSYPLCMRQLHESLKATHHLKHAGRLQYGLFLKAAGVVYEDAIRFWRDEFLKGAMDQDKFDKSYAYNVRYNYGKEGSRKNYSAYSCVKIINGTIGPQDSHGCPFKHSDPSVLKNRLIAYNVNSQDISAIMDLINKGHYQIACGKYFDVTHSIQMELGINHPNQYFEESQNILSGNFKPIDRIKLEKLNNSNIQSDVKSENQWEEFDIENMETDISQM